MRRVTGVEYKLISIMVMINLWWVGTLAYKNPIKSFTSVATLFRNFAKMIGRKQYIRAFHVNGKYVWDIFSPGWPSKGFNSFFVNQLHEINPISEHYTSLRRLLIAITKRCPLQCEHCSEGATLYQDDAMSYEQLRDKIETFVQQGVGQLVYSGGEPLSRFDDLVKLITHFHDPCDQWIYTSGYGLTLKKANALKNAGLDGIAISLDHHLEEHHNHFRGNSKSFFWVLEAIKNCEQAGIMVALNLCPTRDYLENFDLRNYLQLAKELHVPIVNILEPRAVGNYQGKQVELDQYHKDILQRLCHQYNFDKARLDFPTIVYPAAFRKILPCGGGRSYLFLDYDGKLYPCSFCKVPVSDVSLSRNACLA